MAVVTLNYQSLVASQVTLTGPGLGSSNNQVTQTALNSQRTLTGTGNASQPAITEAICGNLTLSGGSGTIDLGALTGLQGSVNLTGLKVQVMKFINPSTNANKITITKGATNGYGLGTDGSTFTVPLHPGGEFTYYCNEGTPDVGSGAKTFDVTGSGSQVLQYAIHAG